MTEITDLPIEIVRRGDVDEAAVDYALKRLDAVNHLIGEPILFMRVRLTNEGNGYRNRPSLAQATLDINGELLRAQVGADTLTEAIDLLADRLRDQLQHRAERRRARRAARPGAWRHGDGREPRPLFAERPVDERNVVSRKSFAIHPATPDEAAADMEQLDYDFWLFRDLASDADAVIEQLPDGGYRLQRVRQPDAEAGPVAIDLTVVAQTAPELALDVAIRQLDDSGQRFVFFVDPDTGRGNLVYRRYDGHYGVLTPA